VDASGMDWASGIEPILATFNHSSTWPHLLRHSAFPWWALTYSGFVSACHDSNLGAIQSQRFKSWDVFDPLCLRACRSGPS
jgi:hypothetical protein